VTTPINTDKHPSLPLAHSPADQAGKARVSHRSETDAEGKAGETAQAVAGDDQNMDVTRANQMLDLTTGSLARRPGGSIETDAQAQAAVGRLEALVKEDPEAALRAQASGLNELHRALLEGQPT